MISDSRANELGFGERLARLEAENRRMAAEVRRSRRINLAMLLVGGIAGLAGAASYRMADVVEASQFVLKDNKGNVRAVLGCTLDEEQEPYLELYDRRGDSRLLMDISPREVPRLILREKEDKPRLVLDLDKDGSPGVFMLDKERNSLLEIASNNGTGFHGIRYSRDDKNRFLLGAAPDGMAALEIFDEQGEPRLVLRHHEKAEGGGVNGLYFCDWNGDSGILGRQADGKIGLGTFNKDGRPILEFYRTPGGDPLLKMGSDDGNKAVEITTDPPADPQ